MKSIQAVSVNRTASRLKKRTQHFSDLTTSQSHREATASQDLADFLFPARRYSEKQD